MKPCRDQPCDLSRLILPSGARSPFCYWHRLNRTTPAGQEIEAQRRLDRSGTPVLTMIDPDAWQWCSGCESNVPRWYASGAKCKACARLARRTYPPGFTAELVRDLMKLQGGRCAICGNRQQRQALAGDHNHRTNMARGLLCDTCNHKLLGGAHDSLRILEAAVYYLRNPPTSGRWLPPEQR